MKRYLLILMSALFIFMSSDLYAQRRNPAKNADLAFGRKQYTEAADRYKKAYRKVRRNKDERNRIPTPTPRSTSTWLRPIKSTRSSRTPSRCMSFTAKRYPTTREAL